MLYRWHNNLRKCEFFFILFPQDACKLSSCFILTFCIWKPSKVRALEDPFFPNVSVTALRKIRKRIEARLSPCLTPHVALNEVLTSSMFRNIVVLLYNFLSTMMTFSGILYFWRIFQRTSQLTILYILIRSTKTQLDECPYSGIIFKLKFTAKFTSMQPFLCNKPHCAFLWKSKNMFLTCLLR